MITVDFVSDRGRMSFMSVTPTPAGGRYTIPSTPPLAKSACALSGLSYFMDAHVGV